MTQYIDPSRLKTPLKRVGKRVKGMEEISWSEAFDLIESKMNAIRDSYGSESVIFSMGTGRDIGAWICLLAYAFGSPNVMFALSGLACYSPRIAAVETVLGDYCVFDAAQWLPERFENPKFKVPECMIVWGYNIAASCPDNIFGHWITDLMKKGPNYLYRPPADLVCFMSREMAPASPGTDGALAMGFLNIIIRKDSTTGNLWRNGPTLPPDQAG
jgi:anaerobic selenocysteine-containing dehydrogenase